MCTSLLTRSASLPQFWMNPKSTTEMHISTQISSEAFCGKNELSLNEENRKIYNLALNFINKFHAVLNNQLSELYGTREDCNFKEEMFKCPEIPNYSSLFVLINTTLNSTQATEHIVQVTEQPQTVIESLPEFVGPDDLLINPNFSSELNKLDYIANCKNLVQNQSVNTVNQCTAPKCTTTSKSEQFESEHIQRETDTNPEAKTDNCNSSSEHKTVNAIHEVKDIKKRIQLVKSSFNIVNVTPCIDLINYSHNKDKIKKQERTHLSTTKNYAYDKPVIPCFNVRPATPKKVKKMFDMISQERDNKQKFLCQVIHDKKYEENSDTDSIILDDEQFERINQNTKSNNTIKAGRQQVKTSDIERTNPFQLNRKDLTHVNEEALSAIGLFTNRGDIKPDVIDILESQRSLKVNDTRNKQFRTKRQWDFQIHLKPKGDFTESPPSVSSDLLSYSSDIKIQVTNVESQYKVP